MNHVITLTDESVISKIYLIRDKRVMLDKDLAEMYGVLTKRLNEQVKRNIDRFPEDFMFQLSETEFENLRSQFATSSWGGLRSRPYAFTEHGVLMLSSVLSSPTAIQVNIKIMRVYTRLREMFLTNKEILLKLEQLEKKALSQDQHSERLENDIQLIFNALKELLNPPKEPRKPIGFEFNLD
ncbi:MAG: ORF6N domain-containing protein [Bacteroidia bacterium]